MYSEKKNGEYVNIKDKFIGKCIECAILYLKFKNCLYLLKVHILSPFKGDEPFKVFIWGFFEEC